jgi:hypothetical protein
MSGSTTFRSREHGGTHRRESAEQRAKRIELGASPTAPELGSSFTQGQRFTTAGRTITSAAIAFVEEAGTRSGDTAPAGLVVGYALGLVPLVDECIVAVRPGGEAALERAAHVGDAIHVEGSVDRVEALDDQNDIARMTCKVVNQRGERIGHVKVDALVNRGSRQSATCREQDYVKKESVAAALG